MSDAGVVEGGIDREQERYNEAAMASAARLQARRVAQLGAETVDRSTLPLDRLLPARNRAALGVAAEYERMGNRPISPGLEARAGQLGIEFEHLGLTLGSVLDGVDLRATLSQEVVDVIRQALLQRKVVFFRDQHLSEDQQVAFARRFGPLDAFPFGQPGTNPYVLEIVHGPGSPGSENGWHTCLLGLPAPLRERVEHLWGVYDYRLFLLGLGEGAMPDELVEAVKADIPFGVHHPLVRTHPETGKPALYLHGGFLRHESLYDQRSGDPLAEGESERLVAALLAQHGRPEYQCRVAWEEGSIAFWDNRAVQHYAASDYYPNRRVLRRVTVAGDRPFRDPDAEVVTPA